MFISVIGREQGERHLDFACIGSNDEAEIMLRVRFGKDNIYTTAYAGWTDANAANFFVVAASVTNFPPVRVRAVSVSSLGSKRLAYPSRIPITPPSPPLRPSMPRQLPRSPASSHRNDPRIRRTPAWLSSSPPSPGPDTTTVAWVYSGKVGHDDFRVQLACQDVCSLESLGPESPGPNLE